MSVRLTLIVCPKLISLLALSAFTLLTSGNAVGLEFTAASPLVKFSFHDDVFDLRKELRVNIEHIVEHNKARFPRPFCDMDNYGLQTLVCRRSNQNQPVMVESKPATFFE